MSSFEAYRWRRWRRELRRFEPPSSEITAQTLALNRRQFTTQALVAGVAFAGGVGGKNALASACANLAPETLALDDPTTPKSKATSYNNYVEFSPDKKAVRFLARELTTTPWTLEVTGAVEKPFTIDMAELASAFDIEERVYRFRCVEGWSMVVPWGGVALCRLVERAQPRSSAKFVEFVSLERPSEMIGQRRGTMDWPYREALTLQEALHPLTLLTTQMYGDPLPAQNGGPVRLIVPWKYGFKSPKAIVRIVVTDQKPATSWQSKAPSEYGFFGNVNPDVAHPRWSQARENRLGELRKRPTLMLNGYAEAVSSLYIGMNPADLY